MSKGDIIIYRDEEGNLIAESTTQNIMCSVELLPLTLNRLGLVEDGQSNGLVKPVAIIHDVVLP